MLTLAIVAALVAEPSIPPPHSRLCSAAEVHELTNPAIAPFLLTCLAELHGRSVTRRVLIEGAEASGAGIDCGGGMIGRRGARTTTRAPTIAIWSRRSDGAAGSWSRPVNISLSNCTINGSVRIWGMGALGRWDDLISSSRTARHTVDAQSAAPAHVSLTNVRLVGTGSIPLYIGPGVTDVRVLGGHYSGNSNGPAIYLDAESAGNTIRDVSFDLVTAREQISVDGSAHNTIVGNSFILRRFGGVFLYRNCGERGVIRHQAPSNNIITDNEFTGPPTLSRRLVVVGSRNGRGTYCAEDRGYPFGSSINDKDEATDNVVSRNLLTG